MFFQRRVTFHFSVGFEGMIDLDVIRAACFPGRLDHWENMVFERIPFVFLGITRDIIPLLDAHCRDSLICQGLVGTVDQREVLVEQRVII